MLAQLRATRPAEKWESLDARHSVTWLNHGEKCILQDEKPSNEQAASRLNSVAVDAVEALTAIMNDPTTASPMHGNNQQELFLSLPIKLMKMKQL